MPNPDCPCCQKGIPIDGPRICPECNHEFAGNGWDGIDAHWRKHHASRLHYEDFWKSLCENHRGKGRGTVHYPKRYLRFIKERGVGRNDKTASSPKSYLSYLNSVSRIIRQDITPELLNSKEDINRISSLLEGEKKPQTLKNYTSAMRQYADMARTMGNSPILTDELLNTWDKIIYRYNEGIPADKTGDYSITALCNRLAPIREELPDEINNQLSLFPQLSGLKYYPADFWQAGRKGALLKGYIWNYLAPDRAKTRARLQTTFTIDHTIKAEYVAYPATAKDRTYDISKISRLLKSNEAVFKRFQELLTALPEGFEFTCTTGDGQSISTFTTEISHSNWDALKKNGIDSAHYFIIGVNRPREELLNLTAGELASLLLADLSELSKIRGLFEGSSPKPGQVAASLSPEVERARRASLPPTRRAFRPEFSGTKHYTAPGSGTEANCRHGKVVDALATELRRMGFKYSNDGMRDLFIFRDDNTIQVLFEVKTALDTGSIYAAIGQLMLHGAAEEAAPILIVVLPGTPNERTISAFKKLGINCLTYEMTEKIVFSRLDTLLQTAPKTAEGKPK